ncbi:LPS-assembly protein LptD [Stenoxybacter acetivorans]|uniref:LPS-assembly protein LptD n=1 Tax=Stenoxybacter acetivorans TaxID=422441 RepID=UPI0009FDE611|nr:LPS-assembly protein LptD [Stenoxybacter acetivorans]
MFFRVRIRAILTGKLSLGDNLKPLFSQKPLVSALAAVFVVFSASVWAEGTVRLPEKTNTDDAVCQASAASPLPNISGSGEAALPTDAVRVVADKVEGQSQVRVRAEGDVIVERNTQILNADWIDYDQITQDVRAGDAFVLNDGRSTVAGETLNYNLDTEHGRAEKARFESQTAQRRLQGEGGVVLMAGKQRYRLEDVKFNTCQAGDNSWYIAAKSMDADYEQNIGVARDARFVFGGVPLLYTPWIDFPLNGERKSGLLTPTVKIGSDGFELTAPYYLNLAPNYDATIRPHYISRRGLQLGGEVRYLEPAFQGEVQGAWLPDDRKSRYNNRYEIDWVHSHQIGGDGKVGIDFHQVSDDDYDRDFWGGIGSNDVNLNRQIWLNQETNAWGGRLSNYFTFQKYQTLASESGYKNAPYALMPRLSSNWNRYLGNNYNINVFAQATRFTHDSKQEGSRAVLYPSVAADYHNSWGFIRPKVGVHVTHYDLDTFKQEKQRSLNRVLPIVSVDSGVVFERPWQIRGHGFTQTLEPRLFYTYIPGREQNDLPLFDASENSWSYEQLFRENRYSGQDRINAANSLTTALQTRVYDDKNGAERFSAGIGQKWYFNKDSVLLDGSLQKNERDRSDILMFARANLNNQIFLETHWHYNENLNKTDRADLGVRYQPEIGKTISVRYRYGRYEELYDAHYGKTQQIDAALQWPIKNRYSVVARYNYDFSHSKALNQLLGLEYQSPCRCWSVSVVGQRYVNEVNHSKNAVFIQLQLRDLTSVGNNPFTQLRTAIPGYSNIYNMR